MTRRSMPPSFHANLFALAPARSYDPIRCQEPQWPRRPLAIGRRGLPLNPSRSAPGMSSTPSAQSHIRGYRSGGPQSSPSAGGSPSLSTRMRRPPRAQRERGYPRRLPGSPGRGLCLFAGPPAHRAEGPQPPHELGGGGGVRLRLGHAPSSISSRRRSRRSDPFLPCILISSGTPEPLGISLGWCPAWA